MQRERRRDPYPWSWEIPVAIVLIVAAVILTGIQLGRSAANLVAGAGWTWPTTSTGTGTVMSSPIGTAFWTSLPGILGGNPGAGLPPSSSSGLAGRGLLWGSITVTEVTLLALAAWAGTYLYLRWGPGRMRGMATVSEAEKLLGVTRLRRVAPVVRPDLYGKHAHAAPPVHRRAGAGGVEPAGSRIGRGLSSPWLRTDRSKEEHR
jgi:hypothetical protein